MRASLIRTFPERFLGSARNDNPPKASPSSILNSYAMLRLSACPHGGPRSASWLTLTKHLELYAEEIDPMKPFDRITFDPAVMGGKACIRGMRVTVGTVVGLLGIV